MLTLEIRWDISQPGPCGDRDFFGSVLSAWISFAQIKHPIFGVFLNVTLLLLLWYYSSKGWFSLELPQYTFLKQIAFLGVWGMQEDGFGISPWQLLHLCAHCWDQSEKGLVGHKWSFSGTSLCHPVVCTKGSLAENIFQGFVGASPQKRDYLVLIFNSYP